ncbi:hypothetical protein FIBSPDRAFT_955201 [Athelia psychrophila]|uniref:Hydrophobin n=1 Tax=Athelia psychrophila TaxID=1759441 RepID=A0A166IER8_9AGAM|nr:hypothetical protein FIBSPDRAFT_955201 [Fibularhizoctonia sp. CBS 109695]
MQFFKSTLFVAVAVAASFVAAAPSPADQTPCLGLVQPCTTNSSCCSNECISNLSDRITGVGYHYLTFHAAVKRNVADLEGALPSELNVEDAKMRFFSRRRASCVHLQTASRRFTPPDSAGPHHASHPTPPKLYAAEKPFYRGKKGRIVITCLDESRSDAWAYIILRETAKVDTISTVEVALPMLVIQR